MLGPQVSLMMMTPLISKKLSPLPSDLMCSVALLSSIAICDCFITLIDASNSGHTGKSKFYHMCRHLRESLVLLWAVSEQMIVRLFFCTWCFPTISVHTFIMFNSSNEVLSTISLFVFNWSAIIWMLGRRFFSQNFI